jgi:hypothetical protein
MLGKLLSNIRGQPAVAGLDPLPAIPASAPPAAAPAAEPEPAAGPAPAAAPARSLNQDLIAGQQLIAAIMAQPEHADPLRLERHGWKAYSQNDEDGILQEIFRRIGPRHRSFVEFGCGFGLENNTAYLLSQGWRGLWIEGDELNGARVASAFGYLITHGLLKFKRSFITRENIDGLIAEAELGPEIDLLSIDLDGNDYHVWEAIRTVGARVVVIEYNAKFRPPHDWCMTYAAAHVWRGSDQMGSSLAALARLGAAKGYQLVGCGIAGCNAFFVRSDLAGGRFAAPATPEHLFQPPRYYLSTSFYGGQPPSSLTIVEGACLAAGLPWPPAAPIDSISFVSG